MNKTFKKAMSVVLAFMMVTAVCVPGFAASYENNGYPTIRIDGRSSVVYDKDGKQIYTNPDPSFNEVDYAKSLVPIMAQELSKTMITQDWEGYSRTICDKITPLFDMIQLDKNADAQDGTNGGEPIVVSENGLSVLKERTFSDSTYKALVPGKSEYHFIWDWRLDPLETAAVFAKYVKEIKRINNCEKVNIDSRCLGSVIVLGYLYLAESGECADADLNDIANVVLYVPTIDGSQTVGALFANEIYFDDKAIDDFVTYYMNGQDRFFNDTAYGDELEIFIGTLCSLMYQLKVLGFGTDVFTTIYENVKDYMVPRLATHVFFFPTYWAMIDDRYYETAKEQLFKEDSDGYYTVDKAEYAGYIEKIDNYHYNVQTRHDEILLDAKESGINISVIAKYGANLLPVEKNSRAQGDGRIETRSLSLGATCSDISKTLSDDYIAAHDSKYISKDKKIDASTCLFPDNTWFIRDSSHASFPNGIEKFKSYLVHSKDSLSVEDMKQYGYSQYMTYSEKTDSLVEVTGAGKFDKLFTNDFFVVIFRFLTALFKLLTKIGTVKG